MIAPAKTMLLKHAREAFRSREYLEKSWEEFGYLACPDYEKALEEYDAFASLVHKHVPRAFYLPGNEEAGLDSIYVHDPVKICRGGAVMMRMGKELRRSETDPLEQMLRSLKIPVLGHLRAPATMDGGDVLWMDEETLILGRGYRTNDEGIRQFQTLVQPWVKETVVVDMPHAQGPEACLHLMSVVSLVDRDVAVVYSPLMPVRLRQLLLERGYSLIEVPREEYETLGCNVLALAPRLCMLPAGNFRVAAALRNAGAEVFEYEGKHISYFGTGGPTCLTRPILRG